MSKKFRGVGYNMSQPLLQKDKILIGFDENYEGMYLDEKAISLHSCVLGTTGSGKTVLASSAVRQAVRNGWGVLYIDLKGDMGVYKQMRIAAHLCGRTKDIRVINPVAMIDKQGMFGSIGTCSYNPFISIDQSAPLTSAVLNASERTGQSNAFYEEVSRPACPAPCR
jgi:DNA helicase HerA-like ATPase